MGVFVVQGFGTLTVVVCVSTISNVGNVWNSVPITFGVSQYVLVLQSKIESKFFFWRFVRHHSRSEKGKTKDKGAPMQTCLLLLLLHLAERRPYLHALLMPWFEQLGAANRPQLNGECLRGKVGLRVSFRLVA